MYQWENGKWFDKLPYQYAGEIVNEPSLERRREMLQAVPDELRDQVEHHVRDAFERRKYGHK